MHSVSSGGWKTPYWSYNTSLSQGYRLSQDVLAAEADLTRKTVDTVSMSGVKATP